MNHCRVGLACWLALCAACGDAQPVPVVTRCPATLDQSTALPKGSRLIGSLPSSPLKLWDAVPSLGRPEHVDAESRALRESESDRDDLLKDGSRVEEWQLAPGKMDRGLVDSALLACRYGTSLGDARSVTKTSALLLLLLPDGMKSNCKVTRGPVDPKTKVSRSITAACTSSR
jgi:hypothetical protein